MGAVVDAIDEHLFWILAGLVAGIAVAVLVVLVVRAVPRGRAPEPPDAAAERDAILRACLDLSDWLRDAAPTAWSRLVRDLAAIGVDVQIPDGAPFDAEAHDAVGTQAAADRAQDMTVAETVSSGFTDRGRMLRRPQVVVYRATDG